MLLKRMFGTLFRARKPTIEQALSLMQAGRLAEAESILKSLLPGGDEAAYLLISKLCMERGYPTDALAYLEMKDFLPDRPEAAFMRAEALTKLERTNEALDVYRDMQFRFPGFAGGFAGYGALLTALGRWDEAIAPLFQASQLAPDLAGIHNNLGNAYRETGDIRAALCSFDAALAIAPDFFDARQSRYFCLHYLPDAAPGEIFAAASEFERIHAKPLRAGWQPHSHTPDPDRRLRIGYVSGDFRRHPVGYFIDPVIEQHDRERYAVTCYSTAESGDDLTRRLAAHADDWRDVACIDDDRLAQIIRDDHIDILVDLSGHTRGHRLLVFARKPAPLQMTWLGFLDTTGIVGIDYLIADPLFLPDAASGYRMTEQPLLLPRSYLCYRPPDYAPEVTVLPASRGAGLRFGCFNNIAKINDAVVALWAGILNAVPASTLVLKTHSLDSAAVRNRMIAGFDAHGIGADRLDLRGGSPHRELLASYADIDIGLDPFPYTGGLTTLEALWMGVPVITLAGDTLLGRMGATCLGNAGLDAFVARNTEEYLRIACDWASALPRLAKLRAGMRERLRATTLIDGATFTRDLEAGYRQAWHRWCGRSS